MDVPVNLLQMVERILTQKGNDLAAFLREGRSQGKSYETLSMELHHLTDGVATVTASTINTWCRDLEQRSQSEGAA